jgi:hypothetical protein
VDRGKTGNKHHVIGDAHASAPDALYADRGYEQGFGLAP